VSTDCNLGGNARLPLRPAFIRDESTPDGYRFECSACGFKDCRRVTVRKPTGGHYETEFVACGGCETMYHWRGQVPRVPFEERHVDSAAVEAWQARTLLTPEEQQAINEAADKARKGRSWKARRR
jgi:hypothetical protein